MAVIMLKIRVVRIWSMEDLIILLENIKSRVLKIENLSLIIVDSLPCLLFQHFGDDNKIGEEYRFISIKFFFLNLHSYH